MRRNADNFSCTQRRGFTLLEIMLAMLVMSLLVAGIFAIVGGTVQLTDEMTQVQEQDARLHGLHRMCERLFQNLPGDARVRYRSKQSGTRYLGQLAVLRAPHIFGVERSVGGGLTVLETQETRGGYFRLVMRWFTEEQAAAWERGADDGKGASLVLLDDISTLEWRFYNPDSDQWEPLWNEKISLEVVPTDNPPQAANQPPPNQPEPNQTPSGIAKRPGLIELQIALGSEKEEHHLFWVPPVSAVSNTLVVPQPQPPLSSDPNAKPPLLKQN